MTATPETVFPQLAYCRIKGGISAIDTTIPIYPGDASNLLPAWTSGQVFYLTITDAENHIEVVKVTDIKLKYLTVERGQDSTVARLWYDGAMMNPRLNTALLNASLQQGAERQVAFNPNGVLTPVYRGEKVFQTGPTDCEKRWFKNVEGTKWRLVAGAACSSRFEYFDDGYLVTPELDPNDFTISYLETGIIAGNPVKGICTNGDFVFTAEGSEGVRVYSYAEGVGFTLLDNDDPHHPNGIANDVFWDETFLYMAGDQYGLFVYSVSEAGALTLLDEHQIASEQLLSVWSDGDFIYATGYQKTLYTFSVNGSGQITPIDVHDVLTGNGNHVWGDGTFIYVANGTNGIEVYSVDGSGQLTHVDQDDQTGTAYRVSGDGEYIYLANGDHGVEAYSVSELGILTHVDREDPGDQARGVMAILIWIIVANWAGGLNILYMNESEQLTQYYHDNHSGNPNVVCSDGTYVYVGNYSAATIDIYKIELT